MSRLTAVARCSSGTTARPLTDVNQQTFYGAVPLPQEEVDRLVTAGVRAFLRSYAPSSAQHKP
ncbi:hypothetical protein ACIHFD_61025 [Nonomuraea sp. NPDC051941]|uniref:hypothetical protein n=1 Tax=Nonomuraea sp. NPDC051941 TaxID=3364373 RepID=UPI0037C79F3C